MIKAAIIFFIMGLTFFILGKQNELGVTIETGELLLFVFFIFALISFLAAILIEKVDHP